MLYIDRYGRYVVASDELYHHGILGMKWGVRHDSYPLDASEHTAAERKAGWTKSLGNIAKATGAGVAKAAKATAQGTRAAASGIRKGLIKLNKYPKSHMTDEEIAEKVARIKREDELKHLLGKKTGSDKLNTKLENERARREIAKQTLTQLLPAIGRDIIIKGIKDKMDLKLENKKADAREEREQSKKAWEDTYKDARDAGKSAVEALKFANERSKKIGPKEQVSEEEKQRAKKVWEDIYNDARAAGKSAADARKAANENDASIAPRKNDNDKGGGKNGFNIENELTKDIYNAAKKAGLTPTEAADRARRRDDSDLRGTNADSNNGGNGKGKNGNNGGGNGKGQNSAGNDQQVNTPDKDLVKGAQKEIYNEWIKEGHSPAEALRAASTMNDNIGKWKANREAQAKAAEKARNAAAAAQKAADTRKRNEAEAAEKKRVEDARNYYLGMEQNRVENRIKNELGGTIVRRTTNEVIYRDSKGYERSMNYADAALNKFHEHERKRKEQS